MTLVESLALSLGPAIAKAILKCWLKDGVVLDIASSLTDVLKTPISDAFARERTADQFKAIGRQVAESLKQFFASEGAALTVEAQKRIALALADTLNKAAIDAKLLVAHNLNPALLYRQLSVDYAYVTKWFTESESAFYARLLKETCKCVVDIAATLPTFQTEAFKAVITKENELLLLAQSILQELNKIREEAIRNNPEAQAQEFETDYLAEVLQTQDEVKLFGTDLSDSQRRYRLSVAYVTLAVKHDSSISVEETGISSEAVLGNFGPVDEMLARSRRLLVRGMAGSGKTTLLQWIAVHAARHDFESGLAEWNNAIPFLIKLRDFAHKDLPSIADFPQLISDYVKTPPKNWVREQLETGRAIVLIDGVDEIPAAQREDVREWIKGLCDRFDVNIIVTSRPYAVDTVSQQAARTVEDGWLEPLGFAEAELQPMDLQNILVFVDHWRTAVCSAITDPKERMRLTSHVEKLKLTIEERLPVRNLATSPLLCAMLCSLHRQKEGRIPTRRIELYEACVKMLFARDDARGMDMDYPDLDDVIKRSLLQHIAYWMLENGYSSALLDEVQEVLEPRVAALRLPTTTESVLRYLVDRTGILREPIRGRIDFAHRTFLEFLAAQNAIDTNRLGALLQNAHDSNWRETIILAVGLANRELKQLSAFGGILSRLWPSFAPNTPITEGEGLIKGLLRRGEREQNYRVVLYLLAVACMETALSLSGETRAELEKRLVQVVPPQNMEQALAIAAAGELALPFLIATPGQSEQVAAACVRALAQIGGPTALNHIVAYAATPQGAVCEELHRAWERFDHDEYARRVLAVLHPETKVHIAQFSSFNHIRYYVNLLTLDRTGRKITDLSPLASLTALNMLNLSGSPVTDLSPLAALTALTTLNLQNTNVADLSPLGSLIALTTLNLQNTNVTDLTPLALLTNLNTLDLDNTKVSDLSPLASLTNLTTLNLRETNVTDLTPLASLTTLNSLYLSGTPVTDLSPLASLSALTMLYLSGTSASDVSALASLTALNTLNLSGYALTDFSPLGSLIALTTLNLQNANVTDLTPFAFLTNLTTLNLRNTKVSDLSPLKSLTNLNTLDLQNTNVTDLTPLASLPAINTLSLLGFPQSVQVQWQRILAERRK